MMWAHMSADSILCILCLFLCNPVVLMTLTPVLCLLLGALITHMATLAWLLYNAPACYSSLCYIWLRVVPYFCKEPHKATLYYGPIVSLRLSRLVCNIAESLVQATSQASRGGFRLACRGGSVKTLILFRCAHMCQSSL